MTQCWLETGLPVNKNLTENDQIITLTSSGTAGFGQHSMPPPACNDTGTTFCFPNEEEAEHPPLCNNFRMYLKQARST